MSSTTTTTAWTDFAMRSNLTAPEGQVPIDPSGGLSNCPDIIPQTVAVNDPQAVFSSPTSWSTDYPGQVAFGMPNYIYVRAKNFAPAAETGTISLFAVGSSLINFPSQWLPNPLSIQTGGNTVPLSAQTNQQIVVGPQPFYWDAPPPPAGSDHYCLIALVDTPNTPNPLLHTNVPNTYNTMADLLTNELYAGWKNVAEVGPAPTWTQSMLQTIPPQAGGAGTLLHIYAFGTSGMVGGQLQFSSADSQGFTPPINLGPTTISSPSDTYGVLTQPSTGTNSTILNVSFTQGSSNPGFNDRIVTVAGWVPASEDEVQPYVERGVARRLPDEMVADSPSGGWEVPIGAMSFTMSSTS